jgi:hypothetical protein
MIIPMNPEGNYEVPKGMKGNEPGRIDLLEDFQKDHDCVIISFDKACKYAYEKPKPNFGFFYDTREGKVTHKFSIVGIISDSQIVDYLENGKESWKMDYLPPWRTTLYEISKNRPLPEKNQTWMLLTKIKPLEVSKDKSYFDLVGNIRSFRYTFKGSELRCAHRK